MAEISGGTISRHAALAGLGSAAGLALWMLSENRDLLMQVPGLFLLVFSFTGVFSAVSLALAGPLPLRRALGGGLIVALPVSGLFSLAGQRFAVPTQALDQPDLLALVFLMAFLATPFVLAALRPGQRWTDYATLFAAAWGLTIRYLTGFAFAAVFWLLAFLSDALLSLVQVGVIEWILATEWLVFAITGGVFGLALAVAYELRAAFPPSFVLRLLRLLTVPVLVVVSVFLAAVPLRGLGEVFGALSSAGTLMAVSLAVITLVSAVLDRNDADMPASPLLRASARALAVLLPLLTGLAAWAVVLRVLQYGWTPDRLLAVCTSGFLFICSLLYCLCALRRDWSARIRTANTGLVLAAVVLCAALLSPLLDGNRIAAQSQLHRYLAAQSVPAELPLWEMRSTWGTAGRAALTQLQARADAGDAALADHMAALADADSRWAFERALEPQRMRQHMQDLAAALPVLPGDRRLVAADFSGLGEAQLAALLSACRRPLPGGAPGCLMVEGNFLPTEGRQGLVLHRQAGSEGGLTVSHLILTDGQDAAMRGAAVFAADRNKSLPLSLIPEILSGSYKVGPTSIQALAVGQIEILPWP